MTKQERERIIAEISFICAIDQKEVIKSISFLKSKIDCVKKFTLINGRLPSHKEDAFLFTYGFEAFRNVVEFYQSPQFGNNEEQAKRAVVIMREQPKNRP